MAINPVIWLFDFGQEILATFIDIFNILTMPLTRLFTEFAFGSAFGATVGNSVTSLLETLLGSDIWLSDFNLISLMLMVGFPIYVLITLVGWVLKAIPIL